MATVLCAIGNDPELAKQLERPHDVEANSSKITSANDKLSKYYNSASADLVRRIYAQDFQLFGYSTEI